MSPLDPSQLPEINQTPEQFVKNYFWPAMLANGFNTKRARFALAQAGKESGHVSSNSVASKTNNFLALVAGGSWQGPVYRSKSSGLLFRAYETPLDSFKDHHRLIYESGMYPATAQQTTIEGFARAIAQSPYITEAVGDNRAAYERGILSVYDQQSQAFEGQIAKWGFTAGIIVIGLIALLLAPKFAGAKVRAATGKDVSNFFNWAT